MDDEPASLLEVVDAALILAGAGAAEPQPGRVSPSDGYELFRRAVCEQSNEAWEALIDRYRGLVLAWVRQHASAAVAHEADDYWVTRTFERLWTAIGPERFHQFPTMGALMQYLKLCAHSAVMDDARARRAAQLESLDDLPPARCPTVPDSASAAADRLEGQELWASILRLVTDDSERLVVYLSFAHDLKPGQIYERHPRRYASVADVYRVKRNVLDRLRRCPHLKRLAQP
jgi:DNA-directed RNA polymerase specialized sigma24 family protein